MSAEPETRPDAGHDEERREPQGPSAPEPHEPTRLRVPSLVPVLAVGAALTVGAGGLFGAHVAASTAAGVAFAVFDLYAISRMVTAMVNIDPARQGARWAPVVLIKFLLLVTGVILLLARKVFLPLP